MNRVTSIDARMLERFEQGYAARPELNVMSNAVSRTALPDAAFVPAAAAKLRMDFSVLVKTNNITNQKQSGRCWMFAALNCLRFALMKKCNLETFELSQSYTLFYDKLEKSNNTYENIINIQETNWEYIDKEEVLEYCVSEGGHWQWFVSIVNKYGLVPYEYMPDVFESLQVQNITGLFIDKVKKDCIKLLNARKENKDILELRKMKELFLEENYTFLSKVLGEPKSEFNFEYKDKDSNYICYKNLTPIEFKNKFLTIDLNDFVSLGNLPMYNKEYYKYYREKYLGNIYENSYVEFLNLPINEIKELVIKQLKDNMPVYVRINLRKFRDKKSGVLDTRLYNYKRSLGFDLLTKEEALNTHDIFPHHCMSICGVNISEDGIPQRWKLEDSYGANEKVNGYYVMNDNYFDEFILQAIIGKKYLSKEQLEMFNQDAIEFEINDPF